MIHERIVAAVTSWAGVDAQPHRFGGTEFRVGRRELGHLHGDQLADLPFTRKIRNELIEAARAETHHVLPDTGWVSFWIRSEADVEAAIALFRLSYEHAVAARRGAPESS